MPSFPAYLFQCLQEDYLFGVMGWNQAGKLRGHHLLAVRTTRVWEMSLDGVGEALVLSLLQLVWTKSGE